MKIDITLQIRDATTEQVMAFLRHAKIDVQELGPKADVVSLRQQSKEPQPDQAESPSEAELPDDQPQRTAPANDGRQPVADVIAGLPNKPAKTVSLAEGAQGKEGDEVQTPDGELGIIAACYRGKAVVQFEDGTGEVYAGPDLKSREAPDQHKASSPSQKPAPQVTNGEIVDDDPLGLNEDNEVPEEITRAMLMDQARAAVEVVSSETIFHALKDATGVGKVKDIDPSKYPDAYKALTTLKTQKADA